MLEFFCDFLSVACSLIFVKKNSYIIYSLQTCSCSIAHKQKITLIIAKGNKFWGPTSKKICLFMCWNNLMLWLSFFIRWFRIVAPKIWLIVVWDREWKHSNWLLTESQTNHHATGTALFTFCTPKPSSIKLLTTLFVIGIMLILKQLWNKHSHQNYGFLLWFHFMPAWCMFKLFQHS